MKRLSSRYPSIARLGKLDSVKLLAETREGRMLKVLIVGADGGNETLLAEDFRLSLGGREIRSTRCRMYDDGDGIVFYDGYGFGHGMGLCQYGANGMAKQGRGYRDILRHYYPGAVIRKIP
jgi:stage II sporulation protein D